jgi:cytochrome c oxidase subunit 2
LLHAADEYLELLRDVLGQVYARAMFHLHRMPARVRRKLPFLLLLAIAVLATAGVAAAANGGLTPPTPRSPNAHRINDAYYVVAGFTGLIFLIVNVAVIVFIVRYRSRGRSREVEGAQVHGHTRIEVIWTVIPVVIIALIGSFIFYKLPGITGPPATAAPPLKIDVSSHQFYWLFTYPNGAKSIDAVHLPVGQVATFDIRTQDVNHSWWIPQLGGKTDAIAGRINHTWYQPETTGVFIGQCAEFCGTFHERMLARAIVEERSAYDEFVGGKWKQTLGRSEWEGVCAKCHGMQGQGDLGPAIDVNPLLTQAPGLTAIVRHGRGRMPPVGNDWTKEQMQALLEYVKANVYKGATTSGG